LEARLDGVEGVSDEGSGTASGGADDAVENQGCVYPVCNTSAKANSLLQ